MEWSQRFAKKPICNLKGMYLLPNLDDDSLCGWTSSTEQAAPPPWLPGQVDGFQAASFPLPPLPPFLNLFQSEVTA